MLAKLAIGCLILCCLSSFILLAGDEVAITWHGHAMFTLAFEDGPVVLMDPFEPGLWGMTYPIGPMSGIDVVTVSHEHEDHNYVPLATGSPTVLQGVSTSTGVRSIDQEVDGVRFYTVQTCHGQGNPCPVEDGNAAFVLEGNGLRIAHLGDLGHVLSDAQAAAIGDLDILLVPVGGGGPTIDSLGANRVIELLQPEVIIGMHYETPELGWGIDSIDRFLVGKTSIEVSTRSLVVDSSALPETPTVYVLPYQ